MSSRFNNLSRQHDMPTIGEVFAKFILFGCGLVVMWAVIIVASIYWPAAAHDWYPPLCCSGGDCAPIASSRIRPEGEGGYVVDGKFHVIRKDVQDSPDGQYHACFPTAERMACFWAPPASM